MSFLDKIGNTPLKEVQGILVKLECANPGGSVKDRIAWFMLEQARRRGELKPGDVIVEATSGNTGIAMALVGRQLGHRVIIYMPEHMTVERRRMIERLGAEIRLTPEKGGFEGAIAERDNYRGKPGYHVPDQFGNPDNTLCHRRTTGAEIVAQLEARGCGRVDYFVAGVGTGGTLMGVGQALKEAHPRVRLVAVEPEESAVMSGGRPAEHGIGGIGDGFIPDLIDMRAVDDVIRVSTSEAHEAAAGIKRDLGYCVGRSAGANMVAALRLKQRGGTVVTLWPDCADRYVSVGLRAPSPERPACEMSAECSRRTAELLGS
ncbi:MAG TPA: cysteine synthase family protein [Patescibacteria group bacterium]|nr:cysteine synthase family protein [Patescibacteria group bacterium]